MVKIDQKYGNYAVRMIEDQKWQTVLWESHSNNDNGVHMPQNITANIKHSFAISSRSGPTMNITESEL